MQGVLDLTTTEVADFVVGGVMACDESRFDAIIEKKIPFVVSAGALDMVNFGQRETLPPEFAQRKIHIHNDQVFFFNLWAFINRQLFINSSQSYSGLSDENYDRGEQEICRILGKEAESIIIQHANLPPNTRVFSSRCARTAIL